MSQAESRGVALLGVGGASLSEAALVSRAPAADCVGVEVSHRVSVVAIDLEPVAHVDVAIVPKVAVVLPGSVNDVAVEGETNWVRAS